MQANSRSLRVGGVALMTSIECRQLLSATTQVVGTVYDAYRLNDGTVAHATLADRVVYVDANANAKLDAGEASTTTDLSGNYKLQLSPGTATIRLVERPGWGAAGIDAATVSITADSGKVRADTFSTRMLKPTRVDVLSIYTAAARNGQTSGATLAQIRSLFVQANQVYANSDTNVILNLVGTTATAYRESGSIDDDLDALGDGKGLLKSVANLRKADHADVVTLFTSGAKTPGDSIGVGYEFDPNDDTPAELGFNVVALQDDGFDNDAFTLAHEIGHNLGAGHDQPNNDGPGVTSYAYGYHFRGDNGRLYQDVMDYSDGTALPFFSTPLFSWAGEPIGNATTADNARIIRLEAPSVAAYE